MPSPFPGMDPWLENFEVFNDFRQSFIVYSSEVLNQTLPEGFGAIMRWLEWNENRETDPECHYDLLTEKIFGNPPNLEGCVSVHDSIAWSDQRETYIEIYRTGKPIKPLTVITFLNRAMKYRGSRARHVYISRRKQLHLKGINTVEIDFLREGLHTTALPKPKILKAAGEYDYHACITLPKVKDFHFIKTIKLDEKLPRLSIPVDSIDNVVSIDLQSIRNRIIKTSRYEVLVDYSKRPDVPLMDHQYAWARKILKSKGILEKS